MHVGSSHGHSLFDLLQKPISTQLRVSGKPWLTVPGYHTKARSQETISIGTNTTGCKLIS